MNISLYKQTLKERGWTYRDLAQKTGISLTNVSRIMAGIVKDPRQSTIESIEKALGINLYIDSQEREAGARATVKKSLTPIEDDMLYAFREVGKKLGEKGQRSLIEVAESMAGIK